LESRALSDDRFPAFADKVVLFLHNTSRCDDEPYPDLLREKGGNGFPTVSFLAADGKLVHQLPFENLTLENFEATFERIQKWQALRARVEQQQLELFLTELELGAMTFAEAKAQRPLLQNLTKEQEQRIERHLIDMEFQSLLRATTPVNRLETGKSYLAMLEQDRIPQSRQIISFWQLMLDYAEHHKDADLFERVMNRAKQEMAGDPRVDRYLQMVQARLDKLRGK
jgi:hypothetical protein